MFSTDANNRTTMPSRCEGQPPRNCRGLSPRKSNHGTYAVVDQIPSTLRVLYITDTHRGGSWLSEAFNSDRITQVEVYEASGSAAGLYSLHESTFDAVLVRHTPGELDAFELLTGYRSGGALPPVVVLGEEPETDMKPRCFEAGADDYMCVHTTTVRNLLWAITRAARRFRLEEQCLKQKNLISQVQIREKEEAKRMIDEQALVSQAICEVCEKRESEVFDLPVSKRSVPEELCAVYFELLKSYVIMGSGTMSEELAELVDQLAFHGITARQAMEIHVQVTRNLISELGGRSTRHIMARADLLMMELLAHLAENYQLRFRQKIS